MRYRRFLHSSDDGQPQGGTQPERDRPSDLLERYGKDALRLAEKLADAQADNYKLREKNRTLTSELADAKGKAPADGARVLSADEAAAYDAYAALGKPAELQQALEAKQAAEQRLTSLERDTTLRDVRDVTGYDLDILRDIGGAEWQYTIKEEPIDDKPQRVVYVKDGDTELPIDQHPKVQKFLPALKPATAAAPAGTAYVKQGGGAQTQPGDLASRFMQQQEERRKAQSNPLMPKQGA